jgi:hypothetical protein
MRETTVEDLFDVIERPLMAMSYAIWLCRRGVAAPRIIILRMFAH